MFVCARAAGLFGHRCSVPAGGAYGIDSNESSLHLRSLLQKGVFYKLRRVLEHIPSRHITVSVSCVVKVSTVRWRWL
jgi:hypothetical protein